jgi:hypothetical protein
MMLYLMHMDFSLNIDYYQILTILKNMGQASHPACDMPRVIVSSDTSQQRR